MQAETVPACVGALVLAAAFALLLASPAVAAPEPRALGEIPLPVRSDGARFASWSDGSTVRVIDTRERRSFLVDVPAGCLYSAVGGGELLFSCETSPSPEPPYGPRHLPLLYSLERGEFHWPVEVAMLLRQQGEENFYVTFRDAGRHWIAFEESDGYHVTTPYLYEWHDGRTELRNPKEA